MKIFQQYLFRSLLKTTLGITCILTLIIWLVQSLRFTRMISCESLALTQLGIMCLGLLPRLLPLTFFVGFLIGLLVCYCRIIQDNERDMMSACGVSQWFFTWPSVILACLLMVCVYIITLYLSPMVSTLSKSHEYHLRSYLDPSFITPGLFFQLDGRTFYIHRQKDRYFFEGVFIHDQRHKDKEEIFTGQKSYIVPQKGGLQITLLKGTYHQLFLNKPPGFLTFDSYILDINMPSSSLRQPHLHELPLKELFTFSQKASFIKELSHRLLFPLLFLVQALWIPFLLLHASNIGKSSLIGVFTMGLLAISLFFLPDYRLLLTVLTFMLAIFPLSYYTWF